ncbi:MAG: hypothetical protein Q8K72_19990, partial [Acidimicrobiales bacterium]|nr:hypothetical protein [Acidimicrobiales bacterium]
PDTGCATAAVAVVGVASGQPGCVSWVPYQDLGAGWRTRLAATTVSLEGALVDWAEAADGVASDVVELEAPPSPDLRGAVEAALDELLAMGRP